VIDDRIAQRRADVRRQRRLVRLRRTLLGLLLLVLLVAAAWLERSEHGAVREVRVVGLERLDPSTVLEASGVDVGDAALRIRPRSVAQRVTALVPVREAVVAREGVRTVVIEVTERAPVYTVVHGVTARLVDRDGVVVEEGREAVLPVVRVATSPPEVGELVVAHAALANAHRAWLGLSGPLRSQVATVIATDVDGLSFVLRSGVTVVFGRADRIEEKVRAVGAVLDDLGATTPTAIDVRVPGFPVVRID
jgi:cell division septal protein FtsQ